MRSTLIACSHSNAPKNYAKNARKYIFKTTQRMYSANMPIIRAPHMVYMGSHCINHLLKSKIRGLAKRGQFAIYYKAGPQHLVM